MSALPRRQELVMPIRAAALLFTLTAALPAWAARPAFSPMDVFALEWASDPQISPDGTQVAYVRQSFDIRSDSRQRAIWLVDRDGGGHRPLAGSEAGQASPRWSPDGKRLAFVSADEGGAQIHMVWLADGVTARVTNLLDTPAALAWSPDGRQLAFAMRVPEKREPLEVELPQKPEGAEWAEPLRAIDRMVYRADGEGFLPDAFAQVFVVSADGGTARQLTEGAFDHEGVAWSADGTEILVSANRHDNADLAPADSELYAIEVATGAIRALTRRFGPDAEPAASPDGKYVAYTGFDDAYQGYQRARLYLLRREDGEIRELAADLDRDVENPAWSRDSRRIYFQYDDQGRTRIAECDLSGRVTDIVDDLGGEGWSRP
jgi:Tol biopolymer transport system component